MHRADRRRLAWASALTLAVLPAIWFANREQDRPTTPNVAAAGLPAEAPAVLDPVAARVRALDPMGQVTPGFLAASAEPAPGATNPTLAVGSPTYALVGEGSATYRGDVGAETCLYNGIAAGERVTVVNVDNGRSVECWTSPRLEDDVVSNELVLSPQAYVRLADPTDAPIPVEIRQ